MSFLYADALILLNKLKIIYSSTEIEFRPSNIAMSHLAIQALNKLTDDIKRIVQTTPIRRIEIANLRDDVETAIRRHYRTIGIRFVC